MKKARVFIDCFRFFLSIFLLDCVTFSDIIKNGYSNKMSVIPSTDDYDAKKVQLSPQNFGPWKLPHYLSCLFIFQWGFDWLSSSWNFPDPRSLQVFTCTWHLCVSSFLHFLVFGFLLWDLEFTHFMSSIMSRYKQSYASRLQQRGFIESKFRVID